MSVEARIRQLVTEGGGQAAVDRVVREALGVAGASPVLARRLVESAVRDLRGLALEGDAVVERQAPQAPRQAVLALAPVKAPTALPAVAAWLALPPAGEPVVVALGGHAWRAGVTELARDLAGSEVFALSAASARRVLRLGAVVAGQDAGDEAAVVPLGPIARRVGKPLRSAEDAAALVGSALPEGPEAAARLLARLCEELARLAGVATADLASLAVTEPTPPFDFGSRSFGRDEIDALPETPGVYVFEDAEGDVAYVGKAQNLRRRVASYFAPGDDERAARVRDSAHGLAFERTGSELTALLREQQLLRELRPGLNVQEAVHPRGRAPSGVTSRRVGVVHPSAEGAAEVVVLDRDRGAASCDLVPDAAPAEVLAALRGVLDEVARRPPGGELAVDVEIALSWLADRGEHASVVELPDDPREAADLLARLARDPDLEQGRIVLVR